MDLRYPIGKVQFEFPLTDERRNVLIDQIAEAPVKLRDAVAGLTEAQLDTPYRPDGWTVRQVVHHVPDSHLNAYIRFRWAMTEKNPTIKIYAESLWAELPDARTAPIDCSLDLLHALHVRWVKFLRALTSADYNRTFQHPEIGEVSLTKNLCIYAWHGRHHIAHITSLRERMGW